MKSLALVKLGKQEEAEELARSVVETKPVDETILQALNLTFKGLEKCIKRITFFFLKKEISEKKKNKKKKNFFF